MEDNQEEKQISFGKSSFERKDLPVPAWLSREVNKNMMEISSTDTSITKTINLLSELVTDLSKKADTELNIDLVNKEISAIKNKLSELEAQKASQSESIKSLETFFDKNLQFMVIATESNGRMKNLESQFSSLEKRITLIEDKAHKAKDRTIALWAIAISIFGIVVSILIAIFF